MLEFRWLDGIDEDGDDFEYAVLSDESFADIKRVLALKTLTGAERGDLENALDGDDVDVERLNCIYQNHISELL